jgi:hypothetical protein
MKFIALILLMAMPALAQTNQAVTVEQKLRTIVIPEIEFRDANLLAVIDFLVDSVEPQELKAPICLSIILNPTNRTTQAQATDPRERLTKDIPPLTLMMTNVSLLDAIGEITARTGLRYEFTTNSVLIKTKGGQVLNRQK